MVYLWKTGYTLPGVRTGAVLAAGQRPGGYASTSIAFSVTRWDQGLLTAAVTAPTVRVNLVHRLSEELTVGERRTFLST